MYRVRSKSTGSYFGKYATRKAAELDAQEAVACSKGGTDDWEMAEVAEEEPVEVEYQYGNSIRKLRKAIDHLEKGNAVSALDAIDMARRDIVAIKDS